jgi:hypothetical protein
VAESEGTAREQPTALEASYERLRGAVLGGAPDGYRLGHGVLATRGMVAWIAALSSLTPLPSASDRGDAPTGEVVALPNAQQLVGVLAQMTLALAA